MQSWKREHSSKWQIPLLSSSGGEKKSHNNNLNLTKISKLKTGYNIIPPGTLQTWQRYTYKKSEYGYGQIQLKLEV